MFHNRINEIRKKFGLSQAEFAKKIGITQGAMSALEKETAQPKLNTIIAICETFDIDANWLIMGKEREGSIKDNKYLNETEKQIIESIIKQAIDREDKNKVNKVGNL